MIRDLLAEMLPDSDRGKPELRALVLQSPGGAITCPYCRQAVEYGSDGQALTASPLTPLRYSRKKMEIRAKDYGTHRIPSDPNMSAEQWIAEEKLMPGALAGYVYAEDLPP
jgi:hypothetical protein